MMGTATQFQLKDIKGGNMITNSTILITGGAGFIGSALAKILISNNKIIIFDNFSRDSLQHRNMGDNENLKIIHGDICDFEAVKKAVEGVDYIIHCAGVAGIQTVCLSPTNTMRVNMMGSYNLLEAASQVKGIKRVVCFSTSEVFGGMAFSSTEADRSVIGAAGEARWTYAVSKLAEEHMCMEKEGAIGESFNIGNARSVETIYGLANVVIRVLKSESTIRFLPAISADIELRIPCVDKAKKLLGFEAEVYLEEGVRATAEYYRQAMKS